MSLQFFEIRYFLFKIIDIPSDTQIKCPSDTPTCITPPTHTLLLLWYVWCVCGGAQHTCGGRRSPSFPLLETGLVFFATHARLAAQMLSGVIVSSLLPTSPQEHWGADVHAMHPIRWGFWGATLKSPDFVGSVLCPLSHLPSPTPLSSSPFPSSLPLSLLPQILHLLSDFKLF